MCRLVQEVLSLTKKGPGSLVFENLEKYKQGRIRNKYTPNKYTNKYKQRNNGADNQVCN